MMSPAQQRAIENDSAESKAIFPFLDLLKSIFSGYAQIFFAKRWYIGLIFMAATFIIPAQGLAGLIGLLLSSLFALLLGMPKEWVKSGYFAYNGLLQGLAIGLTYEMNGAFFALLVAISFLGVVIAASLRFLFDRYMGVPVLSLPFVLTTWAMSAAGGRFEELIYTLEPFNVTALAGVFPEYVEFFTKSLGAAFFQLSVPSGLLIALGILIYSRHAFILALVGLASGAAFHLLLGGQFTDLNSMWIGFNFALTAIAVGGMWIVPGLDSLVFAAIGAAVCSLVTAASFQLLSPLGLPVLAFPFVFTTIVMLYALRNRTDTKNLTSVLYPAETPEANLKGTKNIRARFVTHEHPAFVLPVSGEWTITQGFNGKHTHKSLWAHAWDFEILDEDGKAFKNGGEQLDDFYTFKKPVFAPGDGKVVKVVNHIEDNPIGQTNQADNWGNLVIIWHYGNVYSAICHLAKGSIRVEEGETVHKNQRLARVGNSGRSPVPHLHFQAQLSHEIGAPTVECELLNYTVQTNKGRRYYTHHIPKEGEKIQSLEIDPSRFSAASFPLGNRWEFKVNSGGKLWTETWRAKIDFAGNRFLECRENGAKLRIYVDKNVLMLLDYHGPRNTGMSWFFMAAATVPLTKHEIIWKDKLPCEQLLPPLSRFVFDILEPAIDLAKLNTHSSFASTAQGDFAVETELKYRGPLAAKKQRELKLLSQFDKTHGLVSLSAVSENKLLFDMKQVNDDE